MAKKPWNDMTPDEKATYGLVYLCNRDTISDAIVLHKVRLKSTDITPEEEAAIDAQLLGLVLDLATLDAKYQARTRPAITISPPTEEQVAQAMAMSEESDRLIAEQQQVTRAFKLASGAIQLAQKIQEKPPSLA